MLGTDDHGEIQKRIGTGMKRPFSPTPLLENGHSLESESHGNSSEGQSGISEHRPKREKKHKTYTLCEVCNIQLNSPAQAQIHYNGKSHQKRLKQISNGKSSGSTGTPAQSSPLLASLPVPGRPLQPQLDLKHFLPFRLNGSSPLSLFPNFNTMDPVQKAVINHTFGVPQPLKKKQIISCNICHLRFNSTNQAEAHYKGHKHARKLKAMEAQKNKQRSQGLAAIAARDRERDRDREREREKVGVSEALPALMDSNLTEGTSLHSEPETIKVKVEEAPGSSVILTPVSETSSLELAALASPQVSPASQVSESTSDTSAAEHPGPGFEPSGQEPSRGEGESLTEGDKDPKKNKQHLHCPVCKVTVNSTSQLEAHNSGSKHKLMLEGQSVQPRRRSKVVSSRAACKTKRLGSKGSVGVASKAFYCEVCEIYVNSETQLKQHMNSRRHKDRLAGKPPKPKFSPYNKNQQNSVLASVRWGGYAGGAVSAMKKAFSHSHLTALTPQTKLALQKQLTKSLTASFLPSPLNPATLCTMATNPLALRHPAGTATLIQTPLLTPALFRPAPGPLRATHTPIIFSPY
ncbi:zinc finger protein 385C isoform X1 [Megalops cyprinoides]|uniref:zinc finger protein 385C isoform X1 n=1 Tax=Megalops cyprinoides TaxID=118141 RepID=UPI0018656BC1|nr:zinc finger protein 385C isoform X1 [Megalops cyprinoides]